MKESYGEGLASHTGPESCVGRRKAAGEALTGVHADQTLSSEIKPSGTPTLFTQAEGNMVYDDSRKSQASPAESKTLCMRGNSLHGNRRSRRRPPLLVRWAGRRRLITTRPPCTLTGSRTAP
jgi:RNA-directed DNA polymerase